MSDATLRGPAGADTAGPTSSGTDPTIATLVPRRSRRRDLAVAAAAVLVLVGLWSSPPLLRPSLGWEMSGGGDTFGEAGEVVSYLALSPQGFPTATVVSVGDVPGARVADAWLVDDEDWLLAGPVDLGERPDGIAHVRAALADHEPAAHALPQVAGDGTQYLVVLFEVTDCSALSSTVGPVVTIRTSWGAQRSETLDPMPALDPDMIDAALCG